MTDSKEEALRAARDSLRNVVSIRDAEILGRCTDKEKHMLTETFRISLSEPDDLFLLFRYIDVLCIQLCESNM
jgi:hypothetical protein